MSRNEREWALADRFSEFADEYIYPSRWPRARIEKIADRDSQRTDGDKRLVLPEATYCVDEKAYSTLWDGCLVELIQDVPTKNMGWFYDLERCDYLICGYYIDSSPRPGVVYKVIWDELKARYVELAIAKAQGIRLLHSPRGYGLTVFAKIPWGDLTGICETLYRDEDLMRNRYQLGGAA